MGSNQQVLEESSMPIVIKGNLVPEFLLPQKPPEPQLIVGTSCPNCPKGVLQRGTMKDDRVQVYCSLCGFTGDRKPKEEAVQ